MTSNDT